MVADPGGADLQIAGPVNDVRRAEEGRANGRHGDGEVGEMGTGEEDRAVVWLRW